ncbi:MAG: hypothetical protein J0L63_11505 [Anaerolineae bacterium]|nr:hypothetical protein [Anaerolineae bacterium]MBN8619523.1 hypothetical protein [Anaerolineae bacterium]
MGHEILEGPNPHIRYLRIYGRLVAEDMVKAEDLGLNLKPIYIAMDITSMELNLPKHFLDFARESFFVHPNMKHLAVYVQSSLLNSIALTIARVTDRADKLSLHSTWESALIEVENRTKSQL